MAGGNELAGPAINIDAISLCATAGNNKQNACQNLLFEIRGLGANHKKEA